jgi:hypothetical protein
MHIVQIHELNLVGNWTQKTSLSYQKLMNEMMTTHIREDDVDYCSQLDDNRLPYLAVVSIH